MKKLMIAAAIVCAAAVSQAAIVQWKAGTMFKATSAEGGWSTDSTNGKIKDGSATGYLFNLTEAQFTALSTGFDQENIYAAFTAGADAANSKFTWNFGSGDQTLTAEVRKASAGTGALTIDGTSTFGKGNTAYGLLIYEYTDATYGDMFIANIASYEFGSDQNGSVLNLAYKHGGAATFTGASEIGWNAVPEPTSGLLLLLGVAGLALCRRRA